MQNNPTQTKLGSNEISIARMGLGCMPMSGVYGKHNDEKSMQLIQKAYDFGVNYFDTADCYGFGHNELLLGRAIKNLPRDKMIFANIFNEIKMLKNIFNMK